MIPRVRPPDSILFTAPLMCNRGKVFLKNQNLFLFSSPEISGELFCAVGDLTVKPKSKSSSPSVGEKDLTVSDGQDSERALLESSGIKDVKLL